MKIISEIVHSFAHLFYPHLCCGCGTDLVSKDQFLCFHCLTSLPYTSFEQFADNPVEKIFWGRIPLIRAASVFYLTKGSVIEKLLYEIKYRGNKELGIYCGRLLGTRLNDCKLFEKFDFMIPLPLFKAREKKRGYNQSALLCEGIVSVIQKPVICNSVIRQKETETQTGKGRMARWGNIEGRFKVQQPIELENKHILLIDDVVTTGATLEACSAALLEVRGVSVSILTLAFSWTRNV